MGIVVVPGAFFVILFLAVNIKSIHILLSISPNKNPDQLILPNVRSNITHLILSILSEMVSTIFLDELVLFPPVNARNIDGSEIHVCLPVGVVVVFGEVVDPEVEGDVVLLGHVDQGLFGVALLPVLARHFELGQVRESFFVSCYVEEAGSSLSV